MPANTTLTIRSTSARVTGRLPRSTMRCTGPEIISSEISVGHIDGLTAKLRRKPMIWDNLHANDYDGRRFYCGPYSGREVELKGRVKGILTEVKFNKNDNQKEGSDVTAGDDLYTIDPREYVSAMNAERRALQDRVEGAKARLSQIVCRLPRSAMPR